MMIFHHFQANCILKLSFLCPARNYSWMLQHEFKQNSPGLWSAPGFRQDLTPIRTESDDQSHREGTWPSVTWLGVFGWYFDMFFCRNFLKKSYFCRFGHVGESSQSNLASVPGVEMDEIDSDAQKIKTTGSKNPKANRVWSRKNRTK